jgi:precorrin-2 dehydrogenase/sirohydrochlorin ferrochelatase
MRMPFYINLTDKNILVIGGGGVGTLRAKKFIEAGANVKVLSKEFSSELKELEEKSNLELIRDDAFNVDVLKPLIKWAHIVTVAIGDVGINSIVKELAEKYKCFVNLANDASETEIVVPFEGEFEGIRFSVTTEGKSGVVARMVRDAFLEMLQNDEETIFLLRAMDYLKKYMKSENIPVDLRMKLYFEISSDDCFRGLVKKGKVEEAKRYAESLIEEYVSGRKKFSIQPRVSFK